jgi:hypothetical protein
MWVGTMIQNQQSMIFSKFMAIYNLVVPKNNLLRKITELIFLLFITNLWINISMITDEMSSVLQILIVKVYF